MKKSKSIIEWVAIIIYVMVFVVCAFFYTPTTRAEGIQRQGNCFIAKQATKPTAGKTQYTYKHTDGKVYPIYVGARGGYYIILKSKSGKEYKKYLPEVKKALSK